MTDTNGEEQMPAKARIRRLIPAPEFARVIGVTAETVAEWIRSGKADGSKNVQSGRYFVKREFAEQYCRDMGITFTETD